MPPPVRFSITTVRAEPLRQLRPDARGRSTSMTPPAPSGTTKRDRPRREVLRHARLGRARPAPVRLPRNASDVARSSLHNLPLGHLYCYTIGLWVRNDGGEQTMTRILNTTTLRAGLRAAVVVAVAGLLAAPAAQAHRSAGLFPSRKPAISSSAAGSTPRPTAARWSVTCMSST